MSLDVAGNASVYNLNATSINSTGSVEVGGNLTISANSLFDIVSNTTVIGCGTSTNGSIMFSSDSKHYACNGTEVNALY